MYIIEDNLHWINERLNSMCCIFNQMFCASKQSIEEFKHYQHVISINGIFLYKKYIGCILYTTALDGNNQLFLLAFAIVNKEDDDNWSWFIDRIRIFVTNIEDLCIISDLHARIIKAISKRLVVTSSRSSPLVH